MTSPALNLGEEVSFCSSYLLGPFGEKNFGEDCGEEKRFLQVQWSVPLLTYVPSQRRSLPRLEGTFEVISCSYLA